MSSFRYAAAAGGPDSATRGHGGGRWAGFYHSLARWASPPLRRGAGRLFRRAVVAGGFVPATKLCSRICARAKQPPAFGGWTADGRRCGPRERGAPWRGGESDFLLQGLGCVFHGGRVAGASEWGQWGRVRVGRGWRATTRVAPTVGTRRRSGKGGRTPGNSPIPTFPQRGKGLCKGLLRRDGRLGVCAPVGGEGGAPPPPPLWIPACAGMTRAGGPLRVPSGQASTGSGRTDLGSAPTTGSRGCDGGGDAPRAAPQRGLRPPVHPSISLRANGLPGPAWHSRSGSLPAREWRAWGSAGRTRAVGGGGPFDRLRANGLGSARYDGSVGDAMGEGTRRAPRPGPRGLPAFAGTTVGE